LEVFCRREEEVVFRNIDCSWFSCPDVERVEEVFVDLEN
jgi:hypothetical protein